MGGTAKASVPVLDAPGASEPDSALREPPLIGAAVRFLGPYVITGRAESLSAWLVWLVMRTDSV
jgi:hypothetical protein